MTPIPINIADWVGRTPMVQLTRLLPDAHAELFAKLEMFNPGGSVKDRIGVAMIEAAEAEGRIEPGRTTIVEATSGNTGIALAFVAAAKGYDLILTLPQGMSREREALLRLYGAQVHVTESMGGMNEAVAAAQALARDDDFWLPDQFTNPANPVLPEVDSTIVLRPGSIRPSASAASIIATPMRSLTLPPGLYASSFAISSAPQSGARRVSRTIGVPPTRSARLSGIMRVGGETLIRRRE